MKSKPIGALFGVLTLVAILGIAPHAFAANAQVTIHKGVSLNQDCVTAKNCFDPDVLNINPGDTVTWTNTDTVGHTATYYDGNMSDTSVGSDWESSLIKAGTTYTTPASTFQNAGTYLYFCEVHPWMTGQIIVGAAATSGGNMTGTSGNMTTTPPIPGNQSGIPLGAPYTASNQTVPEFGPVASLVLVFAVIGVVIMSVRTRGFLKL